MDVLRWPLVGSLLRWRAVRPALQLGSLLLAAIVVAHGVVGPQIGPRNLATVLTSIHWRGLLIIAIVVAGNLFCTACPMILVRDAGRRLVAPRFTWPRRFRRKWIGLALLALVLFSYELFDIWDLPRATAWIVIGYFVAALAIDLVFRGASFCKFVCPIGQFNFIASTLSPTELRIKEAPTCQSCRTSDCIKGRRDSLEPLRVVRRGCELGLFLPSKVGNLDCTLCLDCVHACPHDNIALAARLPGIELLHDGRRSGVRRLAHRADIAALAMVFVFAALINALAMTAAGVAVEQRLAALLHISSEAIALGVVFVIGLIAAPAIVAAVAAAMTRWAASSAHTLTTIVRRYAFALIPLGVGIWLAHYGFHFFTGALTVVPVAQSAAIDLSGSALLGEPAWRLAGMNPGSVFPIQIGFVLLGTCGSIGLVRAMSSRDYPLRANAAAAPWLAVTVLLALTALWILAQPMALRGVGGAG